MIHQDSCVQADITAIGTICLHVAYKKGRITGTQYSLNPYNYPKKKKKVGKERVTTSPGIPPFFFNHILLNCDPYLKNYQNLDLFSLLCE